MKKLYFPVYEAPAGGMSADPLTAEEVHNLMLSHIWDEQYFLIEAENRAEAERIYSLDMDDETALNSTTPAVFTSICPFCGQVHHHDFDEEGFEAEDIQNQILKLR